MRIEVTRTPGATIVAPEGDLDLAVADDVRGRLTGLIEAGEVRLVLDLAGVPYVDSSGLGVLVATMKRARAAGGDIKLCALQPDVRSLLEMTRLVKIIDVHPSRAEAVASWQ